MIHSDISNGYFAIVEVKDADKGWGRRKFGAGWIGFDYCNKIMLFILHFLILYLHIERCGSIKLNFILKI